MGQISKNLDKVLEIFYENPAESFTIRGIASKTRMPKSTVHNYAAQLKAKGLITKENKASNSDLFKMKKTFFYIEKMFKLGLIGYLINEARPSCMILFGSFRKGESVKESDIDLFIQSTIKTKVHLEDFEKKLGHPIQLFIEPDIKKLPDELFNNVVNGIKLYGYFDAR